MHLVKTKFAIKTQHSEFESQRSIDLVKLNKKWTRKGSLTIWGALIFSYMPIKLSQVNSMNFSIIFVVWRCTTTGHNIITILYLIIKGIMPFNLNHLDRHENKY